MKKLRAVGIVFLVSIVIIALGFFIGVLSIPSIKSISNSWGDISNTTTEITSNITIENNNPFTIIVPRVKVEYTLKMNGIDMAQGSVENISLTQGDTTIEVISYLNNTKIPEWWISHIANNETTSIDINPTAVIDAEFSEPRIIIPGKTIPLITNLLGSIYANERKTIKAGLINLTIESNNASWGEINNETTEILFDLVLSNPLPISIQIPRINYTIAMNDIVVGRGISNDTPILTENNEFTMLLSIFINNNMLDDWFVSHLQNAEHSILRISITSTIEYDRLTYTIDDFILYTHEFDTDILGSNLQFS